MSRWRFFWRYVVRLRGPLGLWLRLLVSPVYAWRLFEAYRNSEPCSCYQITGGRLEPLGSVVVVRWLGSRKLGTPPFVEVD